MVKNGTVHRLPVSIETIAGLVVRSCGGCPMLGSDDRNREVCQHPSADNGIRVRGSLTVRQPWCPLDASPLTIVAGEHDAAEAAQVPVAAVA